MSSNALTFRLRHELEIFDRLLVALSIGCGVLYLVTQGLQPFPGSIVLKGLSVSPLALLVFRRLRDGDGLILGASLVFSSTGDVLLDLDPQRLFVFGLGSFLIAHLLHIVLFLRHLPGPLKLNTGQITLIIFLPVCSAGMVVWLLPGLGDLTIPVVAYICVITAMCLTAVLARISNLWVIAGALLFFLSDSLIGVGKFKTHVPYSNHLVWLTYYTGQLLIVAGFLRHKLQEDTK